MRHRTVCPRVAVVALLIPLVAAGGLRAQDPQPPGCWVRGDRARLAERASPFDSVSISLEGGVVKVCYSRPQKRGRVIMGGLVPYDQPWRLGANEATALYVSAPASVGGVAVEPGWYSLYAVPGEREWRIVVNRNAQRWGIPIDDEVRAADVGSVTVPVTQAPSDVEMLTLQLERKGPRAADLVIAWERTVVRVPIALRAAGRPAGER